MVLEERFPALCAHRGLSSVCPENTLPAFGAAIALGVSELELDLWMSADGVCVVSHDNSMERITGLDSMITGMLWEDIRCLDAGKKFSREWEGTRIPRLEDIIKLAGGKTILNIHIKQPGHSGELVRRTCELLEQENLRDACYIVGDEDVLQAVVDNAGEFNRACSRVELAIEYGCSRVQFGRNLKTKDIERAKRAGMVCNLFYSDDPRDASEFIEMGIDVVLTNYAHLLIAAGTAV